MSAAALAAVVSTVSGSVRPLRESDIEHVHEVNKGPSESAFFPGLFPTLLSEVGDAPNLLDTLLGAAKPTDPPTPAPIPEDTATPEPLSSSDTPSTTEPPVTPETTSSEVTPSSSETSASSSTPVSTSSTLAAPSSPTIPDWVAQLGSSQTLSPSLSPSPSPSQTHSSSASPAPQTQSSSQTSSSSQASSLSQKPSQKPTSSHTSGSSQATSQSSSESSSKQTPTKTPTSTVTPSTTVTYSLIPAATTNSGHHSSVTRIPTLTPRPKPSSASTTFAPASKTCAPKGSATRQVFWMDEQDHKGQGAGLAPYVSDPSKYPVYRNVMDYGVANDGTGDQTANIQKAIDDMGSGGSRKGNGVTRYPAQVYLPSGVYQLESTLKLTVGTIIVGNPNNPPVIKASPKFRGQFLVFGFDAHNGQPETTFMMLMKNVILDTTAVDAGVPITALQWGVAQGSGLNNIKVRMPTGPGTHTGIDLNAGSTIAVTDVHIIGGATGIKNSNQQVNFKNIRFSYVGTAFAATGGWSVLLQGATFESCGTGVNMTGNGLGSLVLLDSTSTNSGPVILFHESSHDDGNQNSQFIIQNLSHDSQRPIAIDSKGETRLPPASHVDSFIWGTRVPGGYEAGKTWVTPESESLLVGGKYFTKSQPTYAEYGGDDIVNVKTVSGHEVKGDGRTDDTKALNAILAKNAEECKITYFPFGVYRVSDTLHVPVGTRIVGEVWSVISGYGSAFKNPSSPRAVVRLGYPGDVGVIEIQDMRFAVGEILPGAKILEVNAAGAQPGDVGLWNTIITVGGTAETTISNVCTSQDPKDCMAAFMVMHLTKSSSAYMENFWGWTADHNIDSKSILTIISTGRGVLVEATKGTWLTGTGSEHHWLYNYNFHQASNVYAGLLQSETPYMQGTGEYEMAPAPWTASSEFGDPDFSWCSTDDAKCRTSLATNVDGGSDIALYNSAAWAFFDGSWNGLYNEPCEGKCQSNMMRVVGAPKNLVWYSISTRMTDVIVLDGKTNPTENSHPGGWEGIIQDYSQFS
ncbi:hypothetical protein N7532_000980 [Penicillium argentinense]|uniref:Rhamnogalacturonase A/B/Epimerase-like pectate lyase domain-containing protein n=1 Tax=Penicillium argentinense TaxID=1131581 RepID=A0A9W9KL91_9EURO|nr:uncharacterized protein N7532_000980 [Penicillium argentinense]KAJ5110445.1 hypothetical protein N7532_000980 [Penicillium argentinense]